MMAAVASGIYETTFEAQQKMGGGVESKYIPIPENSVKYEVLYKRYLKLADHMETDLTIH
jgi:L-ribulokinase